ncbi:hypothetical protein HJC99_01940 [Candidatus Saccharibacteria bacterium]|nr:hypothetical protein [Candidatus Saccharibacteria bacterium]
MCLVLVSHDVTDRPIEAVAEFHSNLETLRTSIEREIVAALRPDTLLIRFTDAGRLPQRQTYSIVITITDSCTNRADQWPDLIADIRTRLRATIASPLTFEVHGRLVRAGQTVVDARSASTAT